MSMLKNYKLVTDTNKALIYMIQITKHVSLSLLTPLNFECP